MVVGPKLKCGAALTILTSIIGCNYEQDAAARVKSGDAHADVGEYDEAIADYTEAIRLNPNDGHAFHNRGLVHSKKHEIDDAIHDYTEALRIGPTAAGYTNRANAWWKEKEYDKAIADCNKALGLDPKVATAYTIRGLAWSGKRDYDKAIADYDDAIRLDPTAKGYADRGNAWLDKKDFDKAIADFTDAIGLDHYDEIAFTNRAIAWTKKKSYDKAIADLNEAIRLEPKYANAYTSRAWILATCPDSKFRDGQQAISDATIAYELSKRETGNFLGNLAAAYAETGDFENAVKWQEKADAKYSPEEKKRWGFLLDLYKAGKPYRDMGDD